jgi:hypothetical protein
MAGSTLHTLLGFCVQGGAEALGHKFRIALENRVITSCSAISSRHAFNSVSCATLLEVVASRCLRLMPFISWFYRKRITLCEEGAPAGHASILSRSGVRQEEPLSPTLLALTLQSPMERVAVADAQARVTTLHELVTIVGLLRSPRLQPSPLMLPPASAFPRWTQMRCVRVHICSGSSGSHFAWHATQGCSSNDHRLSSGQLSILLEPKQRSAPQVRNSVSSIMSLPFSHPDQFLLLRKFSVPHLTCLSCTGSYTRQHELMRPPPPHHFPLLRLPRTCSQPNSHPHPQPRPRCVCHSSCVVAGYVSLARTH